MDKTTEQRICLKFCIANGISCAESLKMLQKVYGESTLSKTRAYEWYSAFKSGRDVVEDLPRSGRPSTSSSEVNIAKVKEMVTENRHLSLREVAAELSVSHESIRTILNDSLGMKRVAARLVPKDLNFLQKLNRVKIAEDMLERVNSDPTFIKRIVTGDETWVYEFDMQTIQQASEWRLPTEPKPKKPRQSRSKVKINILNNRITSSEEIIRHQSDELEVFQKKLLKDQQTEENLSELNVSKHKMLTVLCDRIYSLKILLQEKSDNMVKLQADYELLKNENSILRHQNDITETRTKEDISRLKERLKEARIKLRQTEDNYHQMTEDFNKVQKQLMSATKREADSQESLTIMEKDYRSKIIEIENEAIRLRDLVDKLNEELEETKRTLASKDIGLCEAQDKCKNYADHLDTIREDLEKEKEELTKAENVNRDLIKQLQEYVNENYHLDRQKMSLERNNSTYITELQDMRKSLLELKKECHLKDQSLTYMSADLTETVMSRSELCKESQYTVSCIRDCMEQQKKYNETLAKNLENKQQLLMQLVFEKKALLTKIRKMKRINLLAQKLKRTHKLTGRGFRKAHINGYISPSIAAHQTTDTDLISDLNYTDLREKYLMKPMKIGRRTSTCGNSWWFPKMEHLINEVRKNNRWWNENFKNETESDTSLEENRDYGYQSSSTSK